MPIHVFTHLVNHMCNYQEPLSGIFSPEEKITIIGLVYSIIPPQVNESAMAKCMPTVCMCEHLGCWIGRSKREDGKETVDGSGEHSEL